MKDYAQIISREPIKSTPRPVETAFIYVVDDEPALTDLYAHFLRDVGHIVRAFNHRAEALEALRAASTKPDLLISDYLGLSMPVDRFVQRCRIVHPSLRILMASGVSRNDGRLLSVRPDRFIQKPFTLDRLQQEIKATLSAP